MNDNKERWIDIGKFVAIFAVMTDHLRGHLYSSEGIQRITYVSVSIFIFLMGITTYRSFAKSAIALWKKVIKRIIGILIPYSISAFCYHCLIFKGFSWIEYRNSLINFNASGLHYYVLLYMQLIAIAPIIFFLLKRMEKFSDIYRKIAELMFGGGVALISIMSNLFSNIADIYAVRLFGGSYLLCFYIGMLIGRYMNKADNCKRVKDIALIVPSIVTGIMLYFLYTKGFILDYYEIMGSTINPPGATLLACALGVILAIYEWDRLILKYEKKG